LALFDVYDSAGFATSNNEIGLSAQESGNLNDVQNFSRRTDFLKSVDVREKR